MYRAIALSMITTSALLLSACAMQQTVTLQSKMITEDKLANNKPVKFGYRQPELAWQCEQIYRKTDTWSENQFKGQFTFGGSHEVLRKHAIAYAERLNLKPDYIFLSIPTQKSINNISLNPTEEALIYYYRCKNPPAVSYKIF